MSETAVRMFIKIWLDFQQQNSHPVKKKHTFVTALLAPIDMYTAYIKAKTINRTFLR